MLWLAVVSLAVPLAAAAEVKSGGDVGQLYRVNHWTAEDGLPQNRISALAQTPDGYLWIGTWFGLARFDGVRFTVFNELNTPAMINQTINALAVDNEGGLWIGTADGLLLYRERRFTPFSTADGLPDRKVWRLVPSRAGGVWMHSGRSAVHWRNSRPAINALVLRSEEEDVLSLRENDDGSLMVFSSDGLKRVTPEGELQNLPVPPGAPDGQWNAAWRQQRAERFWVSTMEGLWLFHDDRWEQMQRGFAGPIRKHLMYEDRKGSLWVNRGDAGFWRYAGDSAEALTLGQHEAETSVDCMLEDQEGHLWLGTADGLFQLRPRLIRAVTVKDGLPHNECWSVCEAPDGAVWVETKAGVARIENEQAHAFTDELLREHRMSVLADCTGRLWLGNGHDGLIAWQPGAETDWFWDLPPKSSTVESLYLDRKSRVWVGTDHGATWFENGQPAARWGEFGLPTNSVRSIYQTRDGSMWFGTWLAGAVQWRVGQASRLSSNPLNSRSVGTPDLRSVTQFTTADGLADNRVFVFHEDAEGALWIGTHNGLSRFKDGRFFTFRTEHGLLDSLINWLEEDDFGRLWFSCNRGIFRISRRELNEVAEGKKSRANVAVYGTADGMISPETNGEHQPAGCKTRDGRLWFPTPQGVVVITPQSLTDTEATEVAAPVIIEQVVADGEVIYGDDRTRKSTKSEVRNPKSKLAPGRARVLRIRYTANSFADPRRVRFRYRLAGQDHDWRDATEERVAYYTDLKPGDYRFEVKAANPQGVWSESVGAFAFSLAPHFWQTWPFLVFCVASTIVLAVWLAVAVENYRLRWQRQLLKSEERQALADERTRIARDLHDDLGTALTGLALELDVIRRETQGAPPAQERLGETAKRTRNLAERMREVVWAINPRCDNVQSLAGFLEQETARYLRSDGLRGRFEFPDDIPALPLDSQARHQLALSVREALTNVVRHARASEVVVRLEIQESPHGPSASNRADGPVPNPSGRRRTRHRRRDSQHMRAADL